MSADANNVCHTGVGYVGFCRLEHAGFQIFIVRFANSMFQERARLLVAHCCEEAKPDGQTNAMDFGCTRTFLRCQSALGLHNLQFIVVADSYFPAVHKK